MANGRDMRMYARLFGMYVRNNVRNSVRHDFRNGASHSTCCHKLRRSEVGTNSELCRSEESPSPVGWQVPVAYLLLVTYYKLLTGSYLL